MNWSGWDIAITVIGAANVVVLAAAGLTVRKIVRGPVAGVRGRATALIPRGTTLAASGQRVYLANRDRLVALLGHVGALRGLLNIDAWVPSPAGEPITYRSVMKALATARGVRSSLAEAKRLATRVAGGRRPAAASPPGPAGSGRAPRPSLAMRLGLIPPAARHLPTALRVVKVARGTLAAVRAAQRNGPADERGGADKSGG